MPVVRIDLSRFCKMVGAERRKVLERLPYIGLDIESVDRTSVRVEYSPNRPDLGTDYGIARALRGMLGKETGLPRFSAAPSGVAIKVDGRLASVRPYISCAVAGSLHMDEEDVRQLISLQEDLHNGLGRKRRTVAIGLHDMDAIRQPLSYHAAETSFAFIPLGQKRRVTIESILADTYEGKTYGSALAGKRLYPLITDSRGTVLSFPPIINGNDTRVTPRTKRLFVDVTGTDKGAVDDVLAVISTTLAELGGKLGTVKIEYPTRQETTPDLTPREVPLDVKLIKSVLGLDLSRREINLALAKSRMGVRGNRVLGPRYRIDLLHPIDVAEEVALGYGIDRIAPVYPPSRVPGSFNQFEDYLDSVSTVMAGAGMIELMTYELADERSLYSSFQRSSSGKVTVQNPKSIDHSILRDSLVPTLMAALSGNVKSDYPQKVFEIGRVYARAESGVTESWHLGCLVAHAQSSFTEAKMYLEAACRLAAGKEVTTDSGEHWAFTRGRCAAVKAEQKGLGFVGELRPEAVDAFGLGVPVSGFEIDLSALYELLK